MKNLFSKILTNENVKGYYTTCEWECSSDCMHTCKDRCGYACQGECSNSCNAFCKSKLMF